MPRLNDNNMETALIKGTNFQYSAARIESLGATEYTLVTIVTDVSGSVAMYKDDLEKSIAEIVKACQKSPRADNLMIRFLTFNNLGNEEHGYKLLTSCNPDDYIGILKCGGITALYDASVNAIQATGDYSKVLTDNDFDANAIVFILTDGADNASTYSADKVKEVLKNTIKNEVLESIVTVLIGVDADPDVDQLLKDFKDEAELTQYVSMGDATAKNLAKLAEFVSKSISSQSNSLGSGQSSDQLSLTI